MRRQHFDRVVASSGCDRWLIRSPVAVGNARSRDRDINGQPKRPRGEEERSGGGEEEDEEEEEAFVRRDGTVVLTDDSIRRATNGMWKRLETNKIVAYYSTSAKRRVSRLNPKRPRSFDSRWAPDLNLEDCSKNQSGKSPIPSGATIPNRLVCLHCTSRSTI